MNSVTMMMTIKKLFRHIFAALLFSLLWSLICFLADEGEGGVITESFYDAVKELPFVGTTEFPMTYILAFVIYPILFYAVIVIFYTKLKRIFRSKEKLQSSQSLQC